MTVLLLVLACLHEDERLRPPDRKESTCIDYVKKLEPMTGTVMTCPGGTITMESADVARCTCPVEDDAMEFAP